MTRWKQLQQGVCLKMPLCTPGSCRSLVAMYTQHQLLLTAMCTCLVFTQPNMQDADRYGTEVRCPTRHTSFASPALLDSLDTDLLLQQLQRQKGELLGWPSIGSWPLANVKRPAASTDSPRKRSLDAAWSLERRLARPTATPQPSLFNTAQPFKPHAAFPPSQPPTLSLPHTHQ